MTLQRRHATALLAAAPWLWPGAAAAAAEADAPPPEVLAALPGARLQGAGRLTYFGFKVYDVALWTAAQRVGDEGHAAVPLALSFVYARSFSGDAIAERSLQEMRRQGPIADAQSRRWLADMAAAFPNVRAGDRLTGVQLPGEGSRFFFNGQPSGDVRDAGFTALFFGIWLSPRTSDTALRALLMGQRP